MSFKYYQVSFCYFPSHAVNILGDDPDSKLAFTTNWKAADRVDAIAEEHGIQIRHAYSWPDGSLEKYVYTDKTPKEIEAIFRAEEEKDRGLPGLEALAKEIEEDRVYGLGPVDLITIEELFKLSPEQNRATYRRRRKRKIRINRLYDQARDQCPVCQPGMIACKDCNRALDVCRKKEQKWRGTLKPLALRYNRGG